MKNIVMLCRYYFPSNSASAARVITLAKLLEKLDYNVILLGCGAGETNQKDGVVEGFRFYNVVNERNRIFKCLFYNKDVITYCKSLYHNDIFSAVMLTRIEGGLLLRLIAFCKRRKITVINNVVEWYDRNDFHGITGIIKLIRNRISLIYINQKTNILAISGLLKNYYKNKACNVARIPSIVDPEEYADSVGFPYDGERKLIFAYAGNPGTKDSVLNFIRAAAQLDKGLVERFEIRLYGTTERQIMNLGLEKNILEYLKGCLFCCGSHEHSKIKEYISSADFTILVRPNRKSSHAGFPTKLAESFACGTPVIANITSDMAECLKDEVNSIICKDNSIDECKIAIEKVLNMPVTMINQMKIKAKTDMEYFDYRGYLSEMKQLLIVEGLR